MAQVINTNSLSLITQNNINKNQSALATSIERLSSGLRINSAKDDAAGQAIANRFTSNIKGLTQAARNANDGISVAQTTEGALSEINNNLQRVRELTVQATTGTNSTSDLDSIQDEIKSRLDEIDRVSGQTQFNGVNVLAKDGSMKIQVGANDGQTISIDLKKIDSSTLGLNGFNVNGKGTVANKAATASDLTAAGASGANVITTTNAALGVADALSQLNTGDTVTTTGSAAAVYTYDKSSDSFKTTVTVADGGVAAFAATLKPAPGTTVSGTYTRSTGDVNFESDANGNVTIGGQSAFLTAEGNLTTNNAGAGTNPATLANMFTNSSTVATAGSIKLGETTYDFGAGATSGLTYSKSMSKESVATAVSSAATANTAVTAATIKYNSGVQNYTATFGGANGNGAGKSTDTYLDADKELTTVPSYTTTYDINKDNGEVTVKSGTGTGKYAADVGAKAYVGENGQITTKTTSAGTATKDPLATLDNALANIDKFRSSLGAVQNRLASAVTNLNNTTTNLSEAQSRIQDADYAVEVSNMSKAQIIQQAGNSVLAKANQVPQQIMSLLQG